MASRVDPHRWDRLDKRKTLGASRCSKGFVCCSRDFAIARRESKRSRGV